MKPVPRSVNLALNLALAGLFKHPLNELALKELPQNLTALTSLELLDLSECTQLSDLSALAGLTALQELNLYKCKQLSDISALARVTSLRSLYLYGCERLSDLAPLAALTSLQVLSLSECLGVRRFASLESLLPTLKTLYLFGCKLDDLPPEFCSQTPTDNVRDKVHAHYYAVPHVFVSYAWGDISSNASEADRQRQEVVERLCQTMERPIGKWSVTRMRCIQRPDFHLYEYAGSSSSGHRGVER
jgi:hypothetical protein